MGKILQNGNTKQWTWTTWCVTAIQESWQLTCPFCTKTHVLRFDIQIEIILYYTIFIALSHIWHTALSHLACEIYRLNIDTRLKYIILYYIIIYSLNMIEHVYILNMLICFRRYCRVSVWCLWCLWCGWIHGTLPQAIEGQEVAVVAEELRQMRRRRQLAFLRWFRCKADAKIW